MPDFDAASSPPIQATTDAAESPGAKPLDEKARRSAQFIVFLVVVIDLLGFAIVVPLLPRIAKEFMPGWQESLLAGLILGALVSSFSLMQLIFAPIWGIVSDRVGRRPILLMGLLSTVIFYALFGIACTLGREGWRELGLILLFVMRIGGGIAGATLGTAQAAIADSTTLAGRSRGMALIGAAFGVGFCFGPLLGSGALKVAPSVEGGPGFLAAALSLVAFLLGVMLLPETRRPGAGTSVRRRWLNREGWRVARGVPNVVALILVFFLSTLAFSSFEPTLAVLTTAKGLGLSDSDNYLVFAYVGLVLALAQGGLYRPLARRVREIAFMWMGAVLLILGLGGIGGVAYGAAEAQQSSGTLLVTLFFFLAVAVTGFAFVTPSVQALVSRLSDPSRQGEILGVNQSASALARVLGPAMGMPLYYLTPSHCLAYAAGASLVVIQLLLTLRLRWLEIDRSL